MKYYISIHEQIAAGEMSLFATVAPQSGIRLAGGLFRHPDRRDEHKILKNVVCA
jgi:hypothetical protein